MCTSCASKPGAIERRRHLALAVDALLAQHRDLRPAGARRRRGARVGSANVELRVQPGIVFASSTASKASRAHSGSSRSACIRKVSSDHLRLQLDARRAIELRASRAGRRCRRASAMRAIDVMRQPWLASTFVDARAGPRAGTWITAPSSSLNRYATASVDDLGRARSSRPTLAANAISSERREQPAVGAVVVREQQTGLAQLALRREPALQALRIVDVGRRAAVLAERLRQARAAEPLSRRRRDRRRASTESRSRASSGVSVRRMSRDGRERGDDQRHGRRDGAFLPGRPRQTVRIDKESLPTGTASPSAGHSSSPTAAPSRRAHSRRCRDRPPPSSSPTSRMSRSAATSAAAMFSTASATASRADAGPS